MQELIITPDTTFHGNVIEKVKGGPEACQEWRPQTDAGPANVFWGEYDETNDYIAVAVYEHPISGHMVAVGWKRKVEIDT